MGLVGQIESQWKDLMENGAWSESFSVTPDASYKIEGFAVSGIFCSGTSAEDSPAQPYAPRKSVRKEMFRISPVSLPPSVTDPKRMLQGAVIASATRGTYKVLEVRGEKSGTLSLVLNPKAAKEAANA